MSAHSTPSSGHATRPPGPRPPVTTLAVPTVRITKPQKIAWCMSAARTSRNIRIWISTCSTTPQTRRGRLRQRIRPGRVRRGHDPDMARHREGKEDGRAPEQREDERPGRGPGRSPRSPADLGGYCAISSTARWRPRAWSNGPASVSSACGRTGTIASSDSSAPFGLPGRLTISVRPRTPATPRLKRGERRVPAALGAHRLGDARHLVVEDAQRRLRRDVARRQAGAAGRDDQPMPGALDRAPPGSARRRRGPPRAHTCVTQLARAAPPPRPGLIGPLAGRALVARRQDERRGRRTGRRPILRPSRQPRGLREGVIRPAARPPPRRGFARGAVEGTEPSALRTQSPLLPPVFDTSRIDRISTPFSTPLTMS